MAPSTAANATKNPKRVFAANQKKYLGKKYACSTNLATLHCNLYFFTYSITFIPIRYFKTFFTTFVCLSFHHFTISQISWAQHFFSIEISIIATILQLKFQQHDTFSQSFFLCTSSTETSSTSTFDVTFPLWVYFFTALLFHCYISSVSVCISTVLCCTSTSSRPHFFNCHTFSITYSFNSLFS